MHEHLHEFLEGKRPRAQLRDAERSDVEAWERLLTALQEEVAPSPWLEGRVMQSVTARATRPTSLRRWGRLVARPGALAAMALAAGVVALFLAWPRAEVPPASIAENAEVVYVQFAFEARGAETVALSGSFNGWNPQATILSDPDGDGLWTALVPLTPGVYQYMFVVDGAEWVTDPRAARFVEDGFGRANAIVAVTHPPLRSL